jgi:hypothetical protein
VNRTVPASAIAASYGLTAFAIAIVSGLSAGRGAEPILESALVALLVCYVIGALLAKVADIAVRERLGRLRVAEPVPAQDPSHPIPMDPGADAGDRA